MKDTQVRLPFLSLCLISLFFTISLSRLHAEEARPVTPASVLLDEDFESGNANGWTFVKGIWQVTSGRLTGQVTKKGVALAPNFGGCSQCILEGDVEIDTPGAHASLLGWFVDKRTSVEIRLMEEKDKLLLKFLNNGSLIVKAKAFMPVDPFVNYNIRVSFSGGAFQVFVNDVQVLTAPSSVTPFGGAGFQIKSTGAPATASLGHIVVYPNSEFKLTVTKSGAGTGTVTSNPSGINCGTDCFDTYAANSSVTLTPAADTGSSFSNWTGDCSGPGPCTLVMDSDKTVEAVFGNALGNGSPCSSSTECQSGFCVDGFCCNSACNGTCESCGVSGSEGTCTLFAAGTDPDNECSTAPVSTCGQDGFCNGAGACQLYLNGTTCNPASCASSIVSNLPDLCSGTGTCVDAGTQNCTPYTCNSGTGLCRTSCTVDTDCDTPDFCSAGQCVPRAANGTSCTAPDQCSSNNCVDGFCCNSACNGLCQSCGLAGSHGTCTSIPAGTDPDSECSTAPVSSCGQDGFCNGAGACELYMNGTVCSAPFCSSSTVSTSASLCNGGGVCITGLQTDCTPYICDSGSGLCRTNCAQDTDCVAADFCSGGQCVPRAANGTSCTQSDQCISNNCVDGFCCNTACNGLCQSCSLSPGTCSNIAAGTDPDNECSQDPVSSCGQDGFCNGAGACELYANGTVCTQPFCTGTISHGDGFCTSGSCTSGILTDCTPFNCNGSNGLCFTVCSTSADCAPGHTCLGGSCF